MTKAARARQVQVDEHYEKAVRDLVDAHAKLKSEPLVLAVRYQYDGGLDVHLLEVLEGFPGADTDPPFTSEFLGSEVFRILGRFHLTLVSPGQLKNALAAKARASAGQAKLLAAIRRDGRVIHAASAPPKRARLAKELAMALGLP